MSVETLYLMRRDEPRPAALPELSVVELLCAVETDEGAAVPAGTRGTIVATHGAGEAYEVEFREPAGLATVLAAALRPAA